MGTNKKAKQKKALAIVLTAALLIPSMTSVPGQFDVYGAVESVHKKTKGGTIEDEEGMIEIRSFANLDESVLNQQLALGTALSELNLPEELEVTVTVFYDDEEEENNVVMSTPAESDEEEDDEGRIEEKEITMTDVSWTLISKSEGDLLEGKSLPVFFDGNQPGEYVFIPIVDELLYRLMDTDDLPQITVTVEELRAEDVETMIDALPDYADVVPEDADAIYAAKEAYDSLTEEEKSQVNQELLAALNDLVKLAEQLSEVKDTYGFGRVMMLDSETVEITLYETGILQELAEATAGYQQNRVEDLTINTEDGVYLNVEDFRYLKMLPNIKRLDIAEADCLNDTDASNPIEHEIPPSAMSYKTTLETIILSEKVTSIGRSAFTGCTGLRGDLVIPDSVTYIGTTAFGFYGQTYPVFDSLTLGKNLKTLDAGAFLRCKFGGDLVIPASVENLFGNGTHGGAFQDCKFDGILTFEENSQLKTIGNYAFNSCDGFTGELQLPEGLESIGNLSFSACSGFTGDLILPDSLISIGSAFTNCSGFDGDLVLGENLETIEGSTFRGCNFSGELTMGTNIKKIGASVFYGLKDLSGTLIFGNSLESIGESAFNGMESLTGALVIPASLQTIGKNAFAGCKGLTSLSFAENCHLTNIAINSFSGCSGLSSALVIPAGVQEIGAIAFNNCSSLPSVSFEEGSELTSIGANAFNNCSVLKEPLVIPSGVQEIGASAFHNCSNLPSVSFEEGSELKQISGTAFRRCSSLKGPLILPEGIVAIGNDAFRECIKLDGDMILPASLESLGTNVFSNTGIKSLTYFGENIKNWANNIFAVLGSLEKLDISASKIEKLEWTANNTSLTEILLPSTLTELILTNKRSLEDIDITECSNLVNVNLSNNAIDFSAGKPAQWLNSYSGNKTITGQNIIYYGIRGAGERTIGLGEEFVDDFSIFTKNGTDLSDLQKWTEFRNAYQQGVAAEDYWVSANRLPAAFPIARTPNYTVGVKTDTTGEQIITYTTTAAMLPDFNYNVQLTVGEPGPPSGISAITIKNSSNGNINAAGLTKTYGDANFLLRAELSNLSGTPLWKVYKDENGTDESSEVLSISGNGLFSIKGAGTAYVQASIGETKSQLAKIKVNRKNITITTQANKSKIYGSADAANYGQQAPSGGYGETFADMGLFYTREPGEDMGTYKVFLYSLEELTAYNGGAPLNPENEGFADAYVAACKTKFETENPNYALVYNYTAANSVYKVTGKVLSLGTVVLIAKTYNGTEAAAVNTTAPVGGIMNNELNVDIKATFDSADVKYDGTTVVNQDGEVFITLTGDEVGNYGLPNGYESGVEKDNITWTVIKTDGITTSITVKKDGLSAKISPKSARCYLQPLNKVYDGTTTAAFEQMDKSRFFSGLVDSDLQYLDSVRLDFEDKHAGTGKNILLSSEGNRINFKNYTITGTFTANITPAPLAVSGISALNKVYDGTTEAKLTGSPENIDLSGIIGGDDVRIAAEFGELTGTFYEKNAGTRKNVMITAGLGLEGSDAGNYYLNPTSPLLADIEKAELTVLPEAGQYKALGMLDPIFKYTVMGLAESDQNSGGEPVSGLMKGALSRELGERAGEYAYQLGSLTANSNYRVILLAESPKFEIRKTEVSLSGIEVSYGKLIPSFHPEVDSYVVKIPYGIMEAPTVTAISDDENATVTIKDASGLEGTTVITASLNGGEVTKDYTVRFEMTEPLILTVEVINSDADEGDGQILATSAGGTGQYEYSLDSSNWQRSNHFTGLNSGTYMLYSRDVEEPVNGASLSVTVGMNTEGSIYPEAPASLTADQPNPVIPFGRDFLEITLNASIGGDLDYVCFIEEAGTTKAVLNGNVLMVFEAGTVTVNARTVKNGVMSTGNKTLTLIVKKAGAVTAIADKKDVSYYGGNSGEIAVNASGGTGFYQYRINQAQWQDSHTFTGLKAGIYKISVRDTNDIGNMTVIEITVDQAPPRDELCVNAAYNSLSYPDRTEESLTLPSVYEYGGKTVTITWESSHLNIIGQDGTVTRPKFEEGDKVVTLTATIMCGGFSKTKTFNVTVSKKDKDNPDDPVVPIEPDDPVAPNTHSSNSSSITTGFWKKNEIGWWYAIKADGSTWAYDEWRLISGLWYRFNGTGYMVTGWYHDSRQDIWYYLAPDGHMMTGWYYDSVYQAWFYLTGDGSMATGWQSIEGKWYYFTPESNGRRGAMYANAITPDGHEVGLDGVRVE